MTIFVFTLGDRLRKARRSAGLSSADLAERIGVSRNTVSNYENGRVKPRRAALRRWAEVTGLSLDELLGEYGQDAA